MMKIRQKTSMLLVLAGAALLAGCSDSDVAEINSWMDDVKKNTRVNVAPLEAPKTFIPFAYAVREQIDPFDPNKLLAELMRAAATVHNPLTPDDKRRREFLEQFPVDSMKMVGTIYKGGKSWGLVQIDRAMYQVKAGTRLGQNHGVVTGLADSAISIKEVVQDAGGEWVERMSKLELQESKETNK